MQRSGGHARTPDATGHANNNGRYATNTTIEAQGSSGPGHTLASMSHPLRPGRQYGNQPRGLILPPSDHNQTRALSYWHRCGFDCPIRASGGMCPWKPKDGEPGFPNMPRTREHVGNHGLPCQACGQYLRTYSKWQQHQRCIRDQHPCPLPGDDTSTPMSPLSQSPEQVEAFFKKPRPGTSPHEQWVSGQRALYPNGSLHGRVPTPYYRTNIDTEAGLNHGGGPSMPMSLFNGPASTPSGTDSLSLFQSDWQLNTNDNFNDDLGNIGEFNDLSFPQHEGAPNPADPISTDSTEARDASRAPGPSMSAVPGFNTTLKQPRSQSDGTINPMDIRSSPTATPHHSQMPTVDENPDSIMVDATPFQSPTPTPTTPFISPVTPHTPYSSGNSSTSPTLDRSRWVSFTSRAVRPSTPRRSSDTASIESFTTLTNSVTKFRQKSKDLLAENQKLRQLLAAAEQGAAAFKARIQGRVTNVKHRLDLAEEDREERAEALEGFYEEVRGDCETEGE